MANCTSCGTHGAYNSGFTVECLNAACRFYSEAHRKACLGNAAGFKHSEYDRKVVSTTPEFVDSLRISSKTTAVQCEMCYSLDSDSISLSRWKADRSLECRVAGNRFSATIEAEDSKSPHEILIELRSSDGAVLYSRLVDFDSKNLKFQVNVSSP